MHIVHLEDFFHPDAGYQLNLLSRLQQADGHRVTIVTAELEKIPSFLTTFFSRDNIGGKDRAFEQETGVTIIRVPLLGFYSGRAIFYPRLFRIVSKLEPDVLFVHGEDTLTGMVFIRLAPWLKYPMVLDCHMLEMASLNPLRDYFRAFYRRFITPVILREKIPLIRVVDSPYVEKCLGIPLSHTDLLSFGTDTSHFRPDPETRMVVRAQYGIDENTFLVLYAGKLDETKGGMLLAEGLHSRFPPALTGPIQFLIIGTSDGAYGQRVEQLLGASENKIVRLPTQRYFDLARFYKAADLAVFPKQCSMSFFEAQSCGLPVLFEDNEINAQRAASGTAFVFTPESVADFRRQIMWFAKLDTNELAEIKVRAREYVLKNYDYVPIARQFTAVLERAMAAWKCRSR